MNGYQQIVDLRDELSRAAVALDNLFVIYENAKIFNSTKGTDHIVKSSCEVLKIEMSYEGIGQTIVDAFKKFGKMVLEYLKKVWKFFGDFFGSHNKETAINKLALACNCKPSDIKKIDERLELTQNYECADSNTKTEMFSYIDKLIEAVGSLEKALNTEASEVPSINITPPEKKTQSFNALGYKTSKDFIDLYEKIGSCEDKFKPVMTKCDTKLKEFGNLLSGASTGSEQDKLKKAQTKTQQILDILKNISKEAANAGGIADLICDSCCVKLKAVTKKDSKAPTTQAAAKEANK